MTDISLTINGNRNLIVCDVDDSLVAMMDDPNAEFAITLICSPTGQNINFGEEKEITRKLKAVHVHSIIQTNAQRS